MKRYRVESRIQIDGKDDVLGYVTCNDDGIVESASRPSLAMYRGRSIESVAKSARLQSFIPDDEKSKEGPAVAKAGEIVKIDPDKRLVFGWAYVTHTADGQVVVDKSGDFVDDVEEIEKTAYNYVLHHRAGDANHTNVKASDLVESIVFTPEKIEKMGLPAGSVPLGWWVGFKVADDAVWKDAKEGRLTSFSIHGTGTRTPVE